MTGHVVWLWLCLGWLTEALVAPSHPSTATVCDLAPCQCTRGKLRCDCTGYKIQDLVLRDLGEFGFGSISVSHCARLRVDGRALVGLTALQQVSVSHVARLDLAEAAFSWTSEFSHSGPLVNISHCSVPQVPSYCFHGALREIVFDSVNVSHVQAFAFSAIDHAEKMEFTRVRFDRVEPQAFKKFSVDQLIVSDTVFDVLPTRTMVDVEVHREVKLDKVTIDTLSYLALKIHGCRQFRFARSEINHLEHQALHVHARGSASVSDNVFHRVERGAFVGVTVEKRYQQEFGKQELTFENNTLVDFESGSLLFNTTGFSPRFDWILLDRQCSCHEADHWTSELVYFSSDPTEATAAPQVDTVLYCRSDQRAPTSVRDYRRLFCHLRESSVLLTLAVTAGSVLAVSLLATLAYCALRGRARRYTNVPDSPSPLKQNKNQVLVIPDGKTYRETELHVIVERVEPIAPTQFAKAPAAENDN